MPRFPAVMAACLLGGLFVPVSIAPAATLEKFLSREDPRFRPLEAELTLGLDGKVYLINADPTGMAHPGYVMRLAPDGSGREGTETAGAPQAVGVNAQGALAIANGHFSRRLSLLDPNFGYRTAFTAFEGQDNSFRTPRHVAAGTSGDFYALEPATGKILRVTPGGEVKAKIQVGPADNTLMDFRVDEGRQLFVLRSSPYKPLRVVGFDGQEKSSIDTTSAGGYDIGPDGLVYVIIPPEQQVRRLDLNGKAAGEIKLQTESLPNYTKIFPRDMRVSADGIFVKRPHETELYARFNRETGALLNVVQARHERIAATFPDGAWAAGSTVPLQVEQSTTGLNRPAIQGAAPAAGWRVYGRPIGSPTFFPLPRENGSVRVPAELGGLCEVRITPELRPEAGGPLGNQTLSTWIEFRQPNSRGTVSVWTPDNRIFYGRGEAVPLSIVARGTSGALDVELQVRPESGNKVLLSRPLKLESGKVTTATLPPTLLAGLKPDTTYRLVAAAPNWTSSPATIVLGPGLETDGFKRLLYGDYTYGLWPQTDVPFQVPEATLSHARRLEKMGVNMVSERINMPASLAAATLDAGVQRMLEADPAGTAPEKIRALHPWLASLGAYGAFGTRHMGILLGNDAGLPLGTPYGSPPAPPEKQAAEREAFAKRINEVFQLTRAYPAYRGWSWAANWWLPSPAEEPIKPADKEAYKAIVAQVRATGKWNPKIDEVWAINLGYAPEATKFLNETLHKLAPGQKTAVAAPYRSGTAYPPTTFSNVQEVDLQAQWEQLPPPFYAPHNVDYYKRPGKQAWGHPEVWNDSGTGEQILPTWFLMTMRGANGVGSANHIWNDWANDSRTPAAGAVSVIRNFNTFAKRYGPWLQTLQADDPVVIPISGRMIRLDGWGLGHFWAALEAYVSCLQAHHPASIVFAEDLKPDDLKKYRAIILAGVSVEPEPQLKAALDAARAEGVPVFADKTSRPAVLGAVKTLPVSFNKLGDERAMQVGNEDSALMRLPKLVQANLPAMRAALKPVDNTSAQTDEPMVWLTQRRNGAGRFLWAVNETPLDLDMDQMWRVNLFTSTRKPLVTNLTLPTAWRKGAVYDVFNGQRLTTTNGVIRSDLRTDAARLYALLPAPIASVALRVPAKITPGQKLAWWVQVRDASGKAIPATVPVQVRVSGTGVSETVHGAASPTGVRGTIQIPADAGNLTVEVTELFSGQRTRATVAAAPRASTSWTDNIPAPAVVPASLSGKPEPRRVVPYLQPGPRLRDMTLSTDGKLAIVNAMNWDDNVYAVEVSSGRTVWSRRLGHYFAFEPQSSANGTYVQGFDLNTPEGYHLYHLNNAGQPQRRFALYGIPGRAPHRMYPQAIHDRINVFAAAPSGNWVATAGNLGVCVFDSSGKTLWSREDWKLPRTKARADESSIWETTRPRTPALVAVNDQALIVADPGAVSALNAADGSTLWKTALPAADEVQRLRVSKDGRTVVVWTRAEGGRVYVLRDGKLISEFTSPTYLEAYDFILTPDGERIGFLAGRRLLWMGLDGTPYWSFTGDGRLHFARLSPNGQRLAVTTDLGTLSVLNLSGETIYETDLGAVAAPQWLPGGDLLLADWNGNIRRLTAARNFSVGWNQRLHPATEKVLSSPEDTTPTARLTGWGNALPQPLPLTSNNLLAQPGVQIRLPNHEYSLNNNNDVRPLTDGKPDAPAEPWVNWREINAWGSLREFLHLDMTFPKKVRVSALTFAEDPKRPASWLRDADLEYWNEAEGRWRFVMPLLSDSAVHSHQLPTAVETTKLRIVLPWGLYGNLRLGEMVVHGSAVE